MSHTEIQLHYHHPSFIQSDLRKTAIHLSPDAHRSPAFFAGQLQNPLRFREALSGLYNVLYSDYRYKPKDKTAYLQYLQRQAATSGKSVSAANMRKAEEYMMNRIEEEEGVETDVFDPLLTIHPDQAFFEVFSKDESTYANLALKWDVFTDVKDLHYGTTHIDFSEDLYNALQNIRTYKATTFAIDSEGFANKNNDDELYAKELVIPDSWLKGFLQVQSAATLPMTSFELDPIDLYNILAYLRRNKAKKSPRGVRFELLPGQAPRIILEPWEKLFFGQGPVYEGTQPQIVRLWGRKRLRLLSRLLPLTKKIHVHTLGSGLPTFYTLDMGSMHFTLGLSGWTANDWSSSLQFDMMLPMGEPSQDVQAQLLEGLQRSWTLSIDDLIEDLDVSKKDAFAALQHLCKQGKVIYDLHEGTYRYRELSPVPLKLERLEFRNPREKQAHALIETNAISLTKLNNVVGAGIELHGETEDKEAYRTYQSSFFLSNDGRLSKMKCSSPWFQKTKGKEGPSEYILALFLLYNKQQAEQEKLREQGEDRKIIVAETRSFTQRKRATETLYQLTLDNNSLRVQWGPREQTPRKQKLVFNTPAEARNEYFARIDELHTKGFIDTNV